MPDFSVENEMLKMNNVNFILSILCMFLKNSNSARSIVIFSSNKSLTNPK